jgi:hypothetical protein
MSKHEWKNGDWLEMQGVRFRFVGLVPGCPGRVVVAMNAGDTIQVDLCMLTPLPDCDSWSWQPLKLQAGKWYRRRDGEVVGPTKPRATPSLFQWWVGSQSYTSAGKWSYSGPMRLDLVKEVPSPGIAVEEAPATVSGIKLQEGKWYRRRDGRIIGPATFRGGVAGPYTWRIEALTYTYNGRYDLEVKRAAYDLVEEVLQPIEGQVVMVEGKWYERVDGAIVGPAKPINVGGDCWGVGPYCYAPTGRRIYADRPEHWLVRSVATPPELPEPQSKLQGTEREVECETAYTLEPGQFVQWAGVEFELVAYRVPEIGELYMPNLFEMCIAVGGEPISFVVREVVREKWVTPTDEDAKGRPTAVVWDSEEDTRQKLQLVAVDSDSDQPFLAMGSKGSRTRVRRWRYCLIKPSDVAAKRGDE